MGGDGRTAFGADKVFARDARTDGDLDGGGDGGSPVFASEAKTEVLGGFVGAVEPGASEANPGGKVFKISGMLGVICTSGGADKLCGGSISFLSNNKDSCESFRLSFKNGSNNGAYLSGGRLCSTENSSSVPGNRNCFNCQIICSKR